ncbi:hypothetical protein SD77_0816 [Bacillus badius]|uniref:Bacterial Ig-like domain-containing protein n=2 Tax=Bacillus badius TaxID=1455 RepID=A0ABR5ATZ9_BACBA|nr:hypothetical protein SD77_0816 [Bacillus badius]
MGMRLHRLVVFCISMLLLLIAGCNSGDSRLKEEAPVQDLSDSKNGVTINTEQAEYPTSAREIVVEIHNNDENEFMTGAHVFLEKKVKGTWYRVPMKADSFTEQGIIHPPHQSSSLLLSTNDLKYKLTPGEYRAVIGELAALFKVVE